MDRLANFCGVADAGSIVGAAKGDPVRQSLISRQIRELESFFRVELIRRKGRGLELTEAGRDLAAIGRENFKGLADYAARCRNVALTLRIVASNSIAHWLLLPRLKKLALTCPNTLFEIHHEQTREIVTATREGTYDIAFVRKDALIGGLRSATLGEVGHSLLVPKILVKKAPKTIASVLKDVSVALPVGGRMRETVERVAARAGLGLNVAVSCSSYLQAAQILESEMCAVVLPDVAINRLKVQCYRLPLSEHYSLCLAWSARNANTRPALANVIETLIRECRIG